MSRLCLIVESVVRAAYGSGVLLGDIIVAEDENIHVGAQVAGDGILGPVHDGLLPVEAGVEHDGDAGDLGVFFDDGSDAPGICLFGPLLAQLKTRGDDWVLELEWWDLLGERHITVAKRSWVLDDRIVEMLLDAGLVISGTNEALDLLRRYLRAATIDPWAEYSSTGRAES